MLVPVVINTYINDEEVIEAISLGGPRSLRILFWTVAGADNTIARRRSMAIEGVWAK